MNEQEEIQGEVIQQKNQEEKLVQAVEQTIQSYQQQIEGRMQNVENHDSERMEEDICFDCIDLIQQIIDDKFDGFSIPSDAIKDVIVQYGQERVEYLLANTIIHNINGIQYGKENQEWAESIVSVPEQSMLDLVVTAHPSALNILIEQIRNGVWSRELVKGEMEIDQEEVKDKTAQQKISQKEQEKQSNQEIFRQPHKHTEGKTR